jgi:hypothetical protein
VGFSATGTANNPGHVRIVRQARHYSDISDDSYSTPPPLVPGPRSDSQPFLPPEVEQGLHDLVVDGFVVYCCGPRSAPQALVASYQWEDYVDLFIMRRIERIITARIPAPHHCRVDIFAPEVVVWAYEGPPQCALPALLNLVHPQHPDAPVGAYLAPSSLYVPRAEQRPMTIRLPSPEQVGTRAARLAAAMAVEGKDPPMADTRCREAPEVTRCR